MRLHICRKINRNHYMYSIQEISDITCCRRLTWGFLPEKIYITDYGFELTQVNYMLKLLSWLPVFWLLPIVPFPRLIFFDRGIAKGKTYLSFFSPMRKIKVNDDVYELCLHRDNYVSIMKNNNQIALIKRDCFTVVGETKYVIDLDTMSEKDIKLFLLLVAFADSTYFKNRCNLSFVKYEKYIGDSKFDNRIAWTPNDNEPV